MLDLEDKLITAARLRCGVRLTPDEVDVIMGMLRTLRAIRLQRGVDLHTRGLCNNALKAFDDK